MAGYLFVTGRLASEALRATLEKMNPDFEHEVEVMSISVAALMSTRWIAHHLTDARGCDRVMIPGLCQGDTEVIQERVGVPVDRGPKDLKDLPLFFGRERDLEGYGDYRMKIIAEIPDAYRMSSSEILARAEYFRNSGADVVDLGCPVEGDFPSVAGVVAELKERGFTVSLDTFNPETILSADDAGVDMLLSVNSQNMELAAKLHCKVAVIPDFDRDLNSLENNISRVKEIGLPYVIDPVLKPINFGFTESISRFREVRLNHPEEEMLMGSGNLTELIDADSTGINALIAGVATELGIDYLLTTEVISWARGAVRELDLARKLMHYSNERSVLPKHIDCGLITIKDPPHENYEEEELHLMQKRVKDRNFRIFTDDEFIYVFNHEQFVRGDDPEEIFSDLRVKDSAHAFYLGRELQKAALAVELGKKYIQEGKLNWGYLSEYDR